MTAQQPTAASSESTEDTKQAHRKRQRRRRLPTPIRRILKLLLFVFVLEYLVLPQIAGSRKAIDVLGKVNILYLVVGLALEAGAIIAYALLTKAVLPRRAGPRVPTLLRIQMSTLAVSHIVPGGSAVGSSLGYRLLTSSGVDGPDAGFALATQALGSAVVLNALLWVALVVSIPLRGFNALYGTAAIVGAVLIGGFSLLILLLTRGEDRAAQVLASLAARLPIIDDAAVSRLVHRLAARLRELEGDRGLLIRAVGWAAANWLLDAAALWVFVAAYGHRVSPVGLFVAFGLANVVAAIPLTPGGLGVVEAVLTSTLVGFGTPRATAILGVLTYRLANFWLPIPLGGLSYVSLQVAPGATDERAGVAGRDRWAQAVKHFVDSVIGTREGLREWARRHGIKL
jgi:uncharacterized protein (TIRG00374 family)